MYIKDTFSRKHYRNIYVRSHQARCLISYEVNYVLIMPASYCFTRNKPM